MAAKIKRKRHLLLTHEEWLARTKKDDAADSFLFFIFGTRGRGSYNEENIGRGRGHRHGRDIVAEEALTIPHKPMTMSTSGRQKYDVLENMGTMQWSVARRSAMRGPTSHSCRIKSPH